MKMTVDLDITPEEVRRLFGLPDVEAFNRQLMDDIRSRMVAGAEGYDPVKLLQPYISGSLASWDLLQKWLATAANVGSANMSGGRGGPPARTDKNE